MYVRKRECSKSYTNRFWDPKLKISRGRKKYVGHAKKENSNVILPSYVVVGTVVELRAGRPGIGG